MNITKIDWATASWNPVSGCRHDCPYCYARDFARRFGGHWEDDLLSNMGGTGGVWVLDKPLYRHTTGKNRSKPVHSVQAAFPYDFDPTFHRYRLEQPAKMKQPQNIFVGSTCDLFGAWVPDGWLKDIFEATNQAPQHNYIYLTKNPDRYYQLGEGDGAIIPDDGVCGWFGASACTEEQARSAYENGNCRWMSLEPLHGEFSEEFFCCDALVGDGVFDTVSRWDWIVIGAETGNRKGKVVPERAWIESILHHCREAGTPVFMKDSLSAIWGAPLIQEYPAALQRNIA